MKCPVPDCTEPADYVTKRGERACKKHAVDPEPPLKPKYQDP